jgi:hypothetical protein
MEAADVAYNSANHWYLMGYPAGYHFEIHEPTLLVQSGFTRERQVDTGSEANNSGNDSSSGDVEVGPLGFTHHSPQLTDRASDSGAHSSPSPQRHVRHWPERILQMKCKELNAYLREHNLTPEDVGDLKAAKRRFLNRASAKKNRDKNKAKRLMGEDPPLQPRRKPAKQTCRTRQGSRRNRVTAPKAQSFQHVYQEGEWEEVGVDLMSSGGEQGVLVPHVASFCSSALDFTDDLHMCSPQHFGKMMCEVMKGAQLIL